MLGKVTVFSLGVGDVIILVEINLGWAGGERGAGKFWSVVGLSLVMCRFGDGSCRVEDYLLYGETLIGLGHISL